MFNQHLLGFPMLPSISHNAWKQMVLGEKQYNFQLLGAKILMNRIILSTKVDPSAQNINKCISEVYEFFNKYEKIIQKDIKQIFG